MINSSVPSPPPTDVRGGYQKNDWRKSQGFQILWQQAILYLLAQRVFLWGFHILACPHKLKLSPVRASPAMYFFQAKGLGTIQRANQSNLCWPRKRKRHGHLQKVCHGTEELKVCSALCPGHPAMVFLKELHPSKERAACSKYSRCCVKASSSPGKLYLYPGKCSGFW